jgi:CheY-like chemotaxis protein
VALIDVAMPGLSGYETARRINGLRSGADILVIAVTGYGQEDDRQRSIEAGFARHLTKPVDLAQLERLFAELLPGRRR